MRSIILLVPLFLMGCASDAVLQGQGEQLKALAEYHTAQRKADVAQQTLNTVQVNLATATANLQAAEEVLKEAKQKLDSML